MPHKWHGPDPYIRISRAKIGRTTTKERADSRISSLEYRCIGDLHKMGVPHLRPIHFEGDWRGRPFVIEDLVILIGIGL